MLTDITWHFAGYCGCLSDFTVILMMCDDTGM